MSELNRVKSPCVGICKLNKDRICVGCKRTQLEIVEWRKSTDELRLRILEHCKSRIVKKGK